MVRFEPAWRGSRSLALVVLALGAGCADLEPLALEGCGNGVVQAGETCDLFPDPALGAGTACGTPGNPVTECRYVCAEDGPACPTGWLCGDDGVCRHADGEFEEAGVPFTLRNEEISLQDMDGDGRKDLVGYNTSQLTVRYGAAEGQFAGEFETAMLSLRGPLSLGRIDEDERDDVVMPTAAGLFVLLGQATRTLAPVVYAFFQILDQGDFRIGLWTVRVEPGVPAHAVLVAFPFLRDGTLGVAFLFGREIGPDGQLPPLAAFFPGQMLESMAPVRVVDLDAPGSPLADQDDVAIAFFDPAAEAPGRVELYRPVPVPDTPDFTLVPRGSVLLPGPLSFDGFLFADRNGDGALDLLAAAQVDDVDGVPKPRIVVAYGDGLGGFDDGEPDADQAVIDTEFDVLCASSEPVPSPKTDGGVVYGGGCLPLAAGDLNDDGLADFVTGSAIYVTSGATSERLLEPAASTTRPNTWIEARIADFNDDGVNDVAAIDGISPAVDFFFGTRTSLFNRAQVSVDLPPALLRAGDFDGDFLTDLALVQSDYASELSSLWVLYGDGQGAPSAPVTMGELPSIEILEPALLQDRSFAKDLTWDLVAVSRDRDTHVPSAAYLAGTAERQMLSPLVLARAGVTDTPIDCLIGAFDGDATTDLIVLATKGAPAGQEQDKIEFRFWFVRGLGKGTFQVTDPITPVLPEFDIACARWVAGDIDGDGLDEVLAVDGESSLCSAMFCGADGTPCSRLAIGDDLASPGSSSSITVAELPDGVFGARDVRLVDLDQDGALDLLVAFGDYGIRSGGGGLPVVVYWNDGAGHFLESEPTTFETPVGTSKVVIAPLNLDIDRELEIAVAALVYDYTTPGASPERFLGVSALHLDGRTFLAPEPIALPVGEMPERMMAEDVTGDGLEDLLLTFPDDTVRVFEAVASAAAVAP